MGFFKSVFTNVSEEHIEEVGSLHRIILIVTCDRRLTAFIIRDKFFNNFLDYSTVTLVIVNFFVVIFRFEIVNRSSDLTFKVFIGIL